MRAEAHRRRYIDGLVAGRHDMHRAQRVIALWALLVTVVALPASAWYMGLRGTGLWLSPVWVLPAALYLWYHQTRLFELVIERLRSERSANIPAHPETPSAAPEDTSLQG